MKVRSKHTGLDHVITNEDWDAIKANGKSGMYTVIEAGDTSGDKAPDEVANSNYLKLLEDAKAAVKDKEFAKAKELYTQANEIKSTPHIVSQLGKIEAKLEKEA